MKLRRGVGAVLLVGLQATLVYRVGTDPCLLNWFLVGALAIVSLLVFRP